MSIIFNSLKEYVEKEIDYKHKIIISGEIQSDENVDKMTPFFIRTSVIRENSYNFTNIGKITFQYKDINDKKKNRFPLYFKIYPGNLDENKKRESPFVILEWSGEGFYNCDRTYLQDDIDSSFEGDYVHYKVIFNKVEIERID